MKPSRNGEIDAIAALILVVVTVGIPMIFSAALIEGWPTILAFMLAVIFFINAFFLFGAFCLVFKEGDEDGRTEDNSSENI